MVLVLAFLNSWYYFLVLRRRRTRGQNLAYTETEEILRGFFNGYALSRQSPTIEIEKDWKNRPTGRAHVYFDEETEARRAQQELHMRFHGKRYLSLHIDYTSGTRSKLRSEMKALYKARK
eukprot:GHVU01109333.1.p1 GENE.GHVU01109333.1~~GHVU01109333.1.p1  ORF type:complete len:120 (+),score=9.38 GHVU01109333.1:365-724(+)